MYDRQYATQLKVHRSSFTSSRYTYPNLRKNIQKKNGRCRSFPFIEEILPDEEDADNVILATPQPSAVAGQKQRSLSVLPSNIDSPGNISIRQVRSRSMDSGLQAQGPRTDSLMVEQGNYEDGLYQLHMVTEEEQTDDMADGRGIQETSLSDNQQPRENELPGSANEDTKENMVNDISNKYLLAADLRGQYLSSGIDDEQGSDVNSHVNKLFQFDEDVEEQRKKNFFTFGKKGRGYGEFQDATGITLIGKGNAVISDLINSRVQLCNKTGSVTMVYAADVISQPWCTAVTKDGEIVITSRKTKCVVFISREGEVLSSFGSDFFQCPSGIAVDSQGRIIVTDVTAETVSVHDKSGELIKYLGDKTESQHKFSKPRYVCASVRGDIFVSDSGNHCVKMFDSNLEYVKSFGGFGSHDGQLKYPYGICTDSLGDILVADHYNNRISMFSRDGTFSRQIVTKQNGLVHPQGIAFSADLNLYVTHGHLKASKIAVYKLCSTNQPSPDRNTERVVCYV